MGKGARICCGFALLAAALGQPTRQPTRPPTHPANQRCTGAAGYNAPTNRDWSEPAAVTLSQTTRAESLAFITPLVDPLIAAVAPVEVDTSWNARDGVVTLPHDLARIVRTREIPHDVLIGYGVQLLLSSWLGLLLILAMNILFVPLCCERACFECCGVGRYAMCCCTCPALNCCCSKRQSSKCGGSPIVVEGVCYRGVGNQGKGIAICCFAPTHLRPEREWPLLPGIHTYTKLTARLAYDFQFEGGDENIDVDWPIMPVLPFPCGIILPLIPSVDEDGADEEDGGSSSRRAMRRNSLSFTDDEEDKFGPELDEQEDPTSMKLLTVCSQLVVLSLLLALACAAVILAIESYASVYAFLTGITGAVQEVACVVEDSITWFETFIAPVFNISNLAQGLITHAHDVVEDGRGVLQDFSGIADQLGALGGNLTCTALLEDGGTMPTELADMIAEFDSLKDTISTTAADVVGSVDDILASVQSAMTDSQTLLGNATALAASYTNMVTDTLKGDGRGALIEAQFYIDAVNFWSVWGANVVFWPTLVSVAIMVASAVALLACTTLYRVCDTKSSYHCGSDEGDAVVNAHSLRPGVPIELERCNDCCQCIGVWGLHLSACWSFHLGLACFAATIFIVPATVLLSDGCVIVADAVEYMPRWANATGLIEGNAQIAVDAVDSCLHHKSILSALDIEDKLDILDELNFTDALTFDMSELTFDFAPIKSQLASATPESFGWDQTKADDLLAALNDFRTNACNGALPNWLTPYTLAHCTPISLPIGAGDPTHTDCAPDSDLPPSLGDWARPGGSCYDGLQTVRSGLIAYQGGKVCAQNTVTEYVTTIDTIDATVENLKLVVASNVAKLTNVHVLLEPIFDNIELVFARGNCGFVRSRINGVMNHICARSLGSAMKTTDVLFSIAFVLLIAVVVSQVLAKRLRKYKPVWWAQDGDETAEAEGPGVEVELAGIHPVQAATVLGVVTVASPLQQAHAADAPALDTSPVYASAQERPIMEATFADASKEHHDAAPLVMGVQQRQEFTPSGFVTTISPLERRELRMTVLGKKQSTARDKQSESAHPSTHV